MSDTETRRYQLDTDVRGEVNHDLLGAITFEFSAGTLEAASEQDEYVLEHLLVPQGRATVVNPEVPLPIRTSLAGDPATALLDEIVERGTIRQILDLVDDVDDDTEHTRLAAALLEHESARPRPRRKLVDELTDRAGKAPGEASGGPAEPNGGEAGPLGDLTDDERTALEALTDDERAALDQEQQ